MSARARRPLSRRALLARLRALVAAVALVAGASAAAGLPGVTELAPSPEALTDAQLDALLEHRVAAADVVAIGETIHGSSGMLRVQTRLIRYLVERHGLRLIAWENPTLRSLELADWVSSCAKAKTAAPLEVLYMPTASDRPLWDWVCDFNRAHAVDRIVFRGMDVWDRPWEHYRRLAVLAGGAGVEDAPLAVVASTCPGYGASSWKDIEPVYAEVQAAGRAYERCIAALTTLMRAAKQAAMAQRRTKLARTDDAAFELALSASTLLGWLGFYRHGGSDDILSWNERDRAQGRNLALLMEKHGARRAILAAHASHVSHGRSPADWWGYGDLKSGVFFYAAATGRRVLNVALTAYEASGAQGEWSLPVAPNSIDRKLHEAGHRFAFFASDAAFLAEHGTWWIQNGNFPGAYESGVEIVPADHFDAYIFLDRSHLDRPLAARPIWEP